MNCLPPTQKFSPRHTVRLTFALALCCAFAVGNLRAENSLTNTASTNSAEPFGGSLEFLDGSVLHGQLRSIDPAKGLVWNYPEAKQPIQFKPDNLAWIRFSQSEKMAAPAADTTCQFRFANGDQFFGNVVSLSETELELQTWFGGKFKTPRSALRSIRFFPKGAGTIYEGPTGIDGWQIGKNSTTRGWQYRDGAFIANSPNTIGRDLKLPDASRIEFDLSWSAQFNLLFSLYTSVFDGFNYNSSSYMYFISPGNISLQRISIGSGSSTIGRTEPIRAMLTKKKVHLEFRANKAENFLEVLVDGKSLNQWKDSAGWVAQGTGVLFYTQTEGADVTISNIKVSEWDGRPGSEAATNNVAGSDQLYLANRDTVSGKIGGLRDGKLRVSSPSGPLEIPLQRVTEIVFNESETKPGGLDPWQIQASVSGGGAISFTLEKWTAEKVFGHNKNFGAIALNPKSIREIRFNSDKAASTENNADDILWEADDQ